MAEASKNPVLYLSYDGLTDPLGQSQILPYAVGLSKQGWKFTIISFEKSEAFKAGQTETLSICQQNGIEWTPLPYTKRPPILSTIFDLVKLWLVARNHLRRNPSTFIHCRSYLTTLIAVSMKKRFSTKFIFDMRGFWADERVEGGLWNLTNPVFKIVYKFFKRKERVFLAQANHTISLTHNAKDEIESWGLKNSPITVIPTCVDLELFNPANIQEQEQDKLRRQLGLQKTDFVLLYLGSWGTWYLTQEMLDIFADLKRQIPTAKFLIVTPDTVSVHPSFPFQKDIIITRTSRTEVPLHISISSASVFFIRPSFSKKASSATKLGELLAMGKPVVTNRGWGDVEHINYGELVKLVNPNQSKSLNWMELKEGSSPALGALSLATAINAYNKVYQSL